MKCIVARGRLLAGWTPGLSLLAGLALLAAGALAVGVEVEGFAEPYASVDIGTVEPGVIAVIHVAEGDTVKVGDMLAELDSDVLRASLEVAAARKQASGELNAASAMRKQRKAHLEKLLPLLAKGHARKDEVARARADLAVSNGELAAARERRAISALEYEQMSAQLERRRLRSPLNGVVLRVLKDAGEAVFAQDGALLRVAQLNPLRVTVHAPTLDVLSAKAGDAVTVNFPETGQITQGRVEFVSPVTEADSGTVRVKVLIDNPRGVFRAGIRARLSFGAS